MLMVSGAPTLLNVGPVTFEFRQTPLKASLVCGSGEYIGCSGSEDLRVYACLKV